MKDQEGVFLIVDDEPDMCWALKHILRKQGVASKIALNGREALALIGENCFRLVFLDAKLPDTDGLELARWIREVDPAIRIVLVSGYFYKDDVAIQKALEEGLICGFIDKPFCHDEIIKYIKIAPSL